MLFVIDLLFDKTFSNYWYCDARILKHLRGLFGNYRDIRILFNLFSHDFFGIKIGRYITLALTINRKLVNEICKKYLS